MKFLRITSAISLAGLLAVGCSTSPNCWQEYEGVIEQYTNAHRPTYRIFYLEKANRNISKAISVLSRDYTSRYKIDGIRINLFRAVSEIRNGFIDHDEVPKSLVKRLEEAITEIDRKPLMPAGGTWKSHYIQIVPNLDYVKRVLEQEIHKQEDKLSPEIQSAIEAKKRECNR